MTIDLQVASEQNLKYILDELATKLDVANRIMFDEKFYRLDQYNDLKFLYDHIKQIDSLSPAEVQAFVDELRSIREA
ncbi:MAG TPA: DUF1128 family protein [Pseudogracilibacillus sp.]|nr:DUF1128 family protein [Pseudogracilibacillus sp.]